MGEDLYDAGPPHRLPRRVDVTGSRPGTAVKRFNDAEATSRGSYGFVFTYPVVGRHVGRRSSTRSRASLFVAPVVGETRGAAIGFLDVLPEPNPTIARPAGGRGAAVEPRVPDPLSGEETAMTFTRRQLPPVHRRRHDGVHAAAVAALARAPRAPTRCWCRSSSAARPTASTPSSRPAIPSTTRAGRRIQVPPGTELPLDGFFGLNPAFGDLHGLYQSGDLAFLHAAGSPDPSRSHFDAQDFMDRAAPGNKSIVDGWLNRYLGVAGGGAADRGRQPVERHVEVAGRRRAVARLRVDRRASR